MKFDVVNVPNLRFGEFEGEWVEKKLENLCEKIGDGIHSTPIYDDSGDYYFINGNNFIEDKIVMSNGTKRVSLKEAEKHNKNLLAKNTILISINGTIGSLALFNNEKVVLGKSACFINLKTSENRLFIFNLFKTKRVKTYFISELSGTTIKNLSLKSIRNTQLFIPSSQEQQKIATVASLLDERISIQSKIIEELEKLSKGLSEELFSQQLRFKDGKGTGFPDWKSMKMGEIYSFKVTNSFSRENLNYIDGAIKNIHYGDIHTKFKTLFDITKEYVPFINPEIPIRISEDNYCKEGDIILADASEDLNDVGKSIEVKNLNNEKLLSGLHTILARPDLEKLTIGFGGYLFKSNSIRTKIQKEAQGSKVLSISTTRLSSIIISFPSKEEQARISNFLAAMDEKINLNNKIYDSLIKQKQYFLQQMFI